MATIVPSSPPPRVPHLVHPATPPRDPHKRQSTTSGSHVRKSSLTLFKISASASGKELAPHLPISPHSGGSTTHLPSDTSRPAAQHRQPISPCSSSRRFSFGFAAVGRGSTTAPKSHPSPRSPTQTDDVPRSPPANESLSPEVVRCHVVDDAEILLPFLERPVEVRDLLFNSAVNVKLATRLRSWASLRGSIGDDLMHTLNNVDRTELDDARWVTALRSVLIKEVPDLWADLALTLGADGSTFAPADSQVKSFEDHRDSYEDDEAIDDASDLSSLAPLSRRASRNRAHSRSISAFSSISDRPEDLESSAEQEISSLEVEGLRYLPENFNKAISQLQGTCYPADEDQEEEKTPKGLAEGLEAHPADSTALSQDASPRSRRSRGMSISLSAPIPHVHFQDERKLASECFAGLRLSSSCVVNTDDDNEYLSGSAESSPRARRRAARTASSDNQPLKVQHHRRLSDLVGSESNPLMKTSRPGTIRLPSQPTEAQTTHSETPNKMLSNLRPTAATPRLDDEELLHPQKSKFSFARDFEGPTPSDPRHHARPKAYSMTQYSSHVEQGRLEAGKMASITPYEVAAVYEAEGKEKPADLGVLKDGRTRHPSSGKAESASVVGAFRASLGLSPGTSSLSPINSAASSGEGDSSAANSGVVTPVNRDSKSEGGSRHASSPQNVSGLDSQMETPENARRTGLKTDVIRDVPSNSRDGSESIQASLSSPPHIHRRPGGFGSFSAELEALQKARSRAKSDAAFSSGSQAIASSSEGSALSDVGGLSSVDDDGDDDDDNTLQRTSVTSASSTRKGTVPSGDLGMDFGDDQDESLGEKFYASQDVAKTPSTPPPKGRLASSQAQAFTSSSPRSPRSARGDDHIIIPIPPGGPRSRAQAMSALWKRSDIQYLVEQIASAIGQERWKKALQVMSTLERDTLSDRALLETLATDCFDLFDLDTNDPQERERAECLMCGDVSEEEQREYGKRWKAFEGLLNDGLCVPFSSLSEAKRRCALHL